MLALIVESALRAAVLALLAGLGLKLFRIRNPHMMLTAWVVVLCASLAMPGLVTVSPLSVPVPAQVQPDLLAFTPLQDAGVGTGSAGDAGGFVQTPELPAFIATLQWGTILSAVYMTVAGVLAVRLLMACVLVFRLWHGARPVQAAWTNGLNVRLSAAIVMPATVGRTILLPQDFPQWPPVKRTAVLLHESCHAARGDFYIQLLVKIHAAVFWFSPLAWWLEKRLTELSENTSDDAAIAHLRDRPAYAEVLLDVSRAMQVSSVAVGMARVATVRARIERILNQAELAPVAGWRRHLLVAASLTPVVGIMTSAVAIPPQDIAAMRPISEPVMRLMVQPVVPETVALDADRLLNRAISASVRIYKAAEVAAAPVAHADPVVPAKIEVAALASPSIASAVAPAAAVPAAPEQPCLVLKDIEKMAVADRTTILASTRGGLSARIDLEKNCKGFTKFTPLQFDPDKRQSNGARSIKRSDEICVQDVLEEPKDGSSCAIAHIAAINEVEARQLRMRALTGKDFPTTVVAADGSALDRRFVKVCYSIRLAATYRSACLDAMAAAASDVEREEISKAVRAEVKQEQRRINRDYVAGVPNPPSNFGPTPSMGPVTGYSPTR
jgi:hypothetical protein